MIRFTVPVAPVGKGRPRATTIGGKPRLYTPKPTATFERAVALSGRSVRPRVPLSGPIRVTVLAIARRPLALCRRADPPGLLWRDAKPDADNVLKAVLDALTADGWWGDDAQVVAPLPLSLYAERGGVARVEIMVERVTETPAEVIAGLLRRAA